MPIYEYQCQDCGETSEELQRMSDPHLTECKSCGGVLKRLISSPAFQFKGSGWYVTDYAKSGGTAESGSESKSSTDGAPSGAKDSTASKKADKSEASSSGSAATSSGSSSSPSGSKSSRGSGAGVGAA